MPYTDTYTEGTKYQATKGMGIVELAKLVRKDLKEAFPQYTCKVQVQKYAGGCSLHIQVNGTGLTDRWSDEAKELTNKVRKVAYEYNYDDSDAMSDYFNTRFYCNDVKIES